MILACECGAKLKIDDAKISDKGSRIRCPRCSAILQVKKKADQTLERPPAQTIPVPEKPAVVSSPVVSSSGLYASPSPQSKTILVAHDSESVRDTIRTLLVEAGFNVETAAEGVEALKKATEIKPDAMVLDVGLPGIYGFELCERLKGDTQTSSIKIILLTSSYDVARYKREPVQLYGADDYIEKHHIPEYLTLKLRSLLNPDQASTPQETVEPQQDAEMGMVNETQKNEPLPDIVRHEAGTFQYITKNVLLRADAEQAAGDASAPVSQEQVASSPVGESVLSEEPRSWFGDPLHSVQDSSALVPESFSLDSSIFQQQESAASKVEEADPEAVEKARRLARIIVSDIVLYNVDAARDGIKKGTFYKLLEDDIQEGRQLYEKRVPSAIRSKKDYFQEAFDNYLNSQK